MDNLRGFEDSALAPASPDDEPAIERPPEIAVDERRMHVRAYNHWVSLLGGRPFPLIEDLDPAGTEDFGPHSVLVDFSADAENPVIAHLGDALRRECGLDGDIRRIGDVPPRSLLSRLTDHYLQIIANAAPIGFEAEYVNRRGADTLYRGILMPLSSDGEKIDYIYGVINWKELADSRTTGEIASAVDRIAPARPAAVESPAWADGPNADFEGGPAEPGGDQPAPAVWPAAEIAIPAMDPQAGLGDRLAFARDSAEAARQAEHRSRGSLYRAIGNAYDFALAAEAAPADYAELLEDAGIRVQPRAPMTAVAKLVFGADYDKTRLAEFAAALSWAKREGIGDGGLADLLETSDGGLKAIVQAERRTRRPDSRPDRAEAARRRLREAGPLGFVDLAVEGESEFVLFLGRREADGRIAIVAGLADESLTDKAVRKAAA